MLKSGLGEANLTILYTVILHMLIYDIFHEMIILFVKIWICKLSSNYSNQQDVVE